MGYKLIDELKSNPLKCGEEGKTYELLQMYFSGFPLNTLYPLLSHEDSIVRRGAIWIVSELGIEGQKFLDDALKLIYDEDGHTRSYAFDVIVACSEGDRLDEFFKIIPFLENETTKFIIMRLLSNVPDDKLRRASEYFGEKNSYNKLHKEGLLLLSEIRKLSYEQILSMVDSSESLTRKYGMIAIQKLVCVLEQFVYKSMESTDPDISEFSKIECLVKKRMSEI